MSPAGHQLFETALTLSDDERAELADHLWMSVDGDTQEDVAKAWAAEISRRMDMIERGAVQWVSQEEVDRLMDARYGPLTD